MSEESGGTGEAPASAAGVIDAQPTGGDAGSLAELPSWSAGMDAEDLSFIGTKGWHKSETPVKEILKSYRNVERLRGVDANKLVRIPDAGNDEQMAEFRTRMGVPESHEAYESPTVAVHGEDLDVSFMNELSHKWGFDQDRHSEAVHDVASLLEGLETQRRESLQARDAAEEVELNRDWGELREENTLATRKGFETLGFDVATVEKIQEAIGYAATMKIGAQVGRITGEHRRGDEGNGQNTQPFGLTKEAAQNRIQALSSDTKFQARLAAKDANALKELNDLNHVAFHS